MDRQIIVQRIDPSTGNFNDNNNPKEPEDFEIRDLDYTEYCKRTNLDRYADLIGYPYALKYTFTEREVADLKDALKIGAISRRPSSLHDDELDAIIERMEDVLPDTPPSGWFVRFSACSPKDGAGTFPLWSAREVVEQVASSHRAWTALRDGDDTLYFVPFDPSWEPDRELRVFIRRGRVTCISQYMWHRRTQFAAMTDAELKLLADDVVQYIEEVVPPLLAKMGVTDATCDLYWNDDNEFRIIEFNSYGYWQASGAALFHWQNDRDAMYGDGNVYFRVHA